jgi:hypothetical protein
MTPVSGSSPSASTFTFAVASLVSRTVIWAVWSFERSSVTLVA